MVFVPFVPLDTVLLLLIFEERKTLVSDVFGGTLPIFVVQKELLLFLSLFLFLRNFAYPAVSEKHHILNFVRAFV